MDAGHKAGGPVISWISTDLPFYAEFNSFPIAVCLSCCNHSDLLLRKIPVKTSAREAFCSSKVSSLVPIGLRLIGLLGELISKIVQGSLDLWLLPNLIFFRFCAGTYLFIEASSPRSQGDKARLVSEQFNNVASTSRCLTFWYHMYGASIGKLNVIYKTPTGANSETLIWNLTGQQQTSMSDSWRYASVPVSSNADHSVGKLSCENTLGFIKYAK